jgi:hypothetical protein
LVHHSIIERQQRIKTVEKIIQVSKKIPYSKIILIICDTLGIAERKAKEYLNLLNSLNKIEINIMADTIKWKK